jgi:hypothetical protein
MASYHLPTEYAASLTSFCLSTCVAAGITTACGTVLRDMTPHDVFRFRPSAPDLELDRDVTLFEYPNRPSTPHKF